MEPTQIVEAAAWSGRQQAFVMIASKCSAAQAQCLREIRQTGAHEALGLTWEEFCVQGAGISRVYADAIIRRLDEFGEAYFRLSQLTRVSPETFRQIADRVTEETIELEGHLIPLIPANARKIRLGIQHLRDEVTRVTDYFKVPRDIVKYGVQLDEILNAVLKRAKLARAIPKDELSGLHSLTHHALTRWNEIEELLKPPVA